jgi:ribosomal protein S18 acetylase RimI-like enzyme
MAQAFRDDPAWVYVAPDAQRRLSTLIKLYRGFVAIQIRSQQMYGVGDPLQGVAIWNVPNRHQPSPLNSLNLNTLKLMFTPGMRPVSKRLWQISRPTEVVKKEHIREPNYYYLEAVAVAPEAQGQGLASKLIRPFLAQADAQSMSMYLDTFKESNVRIYKHYGFVCLEQRDVPELGLRLWLMRRPAK